MSIGSHALAEAPIGSQVPGDSGTRKGPPPKRVVVAVSDLVPPPEPR